MEENRGRSGCSVVAELVDSSTASGGFPFAAAGGPPRRFVDDDDDDVQ